MKKLMIIGAAVIAGAGIFAWWYPTEAVREEVAQTEESETSRIADAVKTERKKPSTAKENAKALVQRPRRSTEEAARIEKEMETEELPPAEQKLVEEMQEITEEDAYPRLKALVAKAEKSDRAEVRMEAVNALRWFGKQALAEVTPFLADPDAEVAGQAMEVVEQALSEFTEEQEAAKLKYIESVLSVPGACDESGVEMLTAELKGMLDEASTAEAISRLLNGKPVETTAESLKEAYEFVTGEEYVDSKTAKDWAQTKRAELAAEEE